MKKRLMSLALAGAILVGSVPALAQGPKCKRLNGDNRYQTSVAISKEAFNQSETAILASGESFADALAGGQLAAALKAPILLSPSKEIDGDVSAELARLGVKKIYILGGNNTISTDIEKSLSKLYQVDRLAGTDRYETSKEIMEETKKYGNFDKILYVSGTSFPDALAAGAYLGPNKALLLLSDGRTSGEDGLEEIAVGGENSLKLPGFTGRRIAGANRYETALGLAKEMNQSEVAILASGESYPDALSAVGLAAKIESPILLSAKTNLDKGVETFLEDKELIYLVGGPNTLSKSMENLLNGEKPADEKPADENPEEEKPIEKPEKEKPTAEEVREELIGLINDERQRVGRQALGQGPYQDLADQRAEEIVKKLSHTRPDGSKATTKLLIENDYFVAAENIVMGYSAQNMFNAWKGSPGHYNNMINEEFKRSCIGIFEYDGYYYGVQLFTD